MLDHQKHAKWWTEWLTPVNLLLNRLDFSEFDQVRKYFGKIKIVGIIKALPTPSVSTGIKCTFHPFLMIIYYSVGSTPHKG